MSRGFDVGFERKLSDSEGFTDFFKAGAGDWDAAVDRRT
jgi:hypothetical protein